MKRYFCAIAMLAMLAGAPVCNATLITYSATHVAESTWRYDYSITNEWPVEPIREFTVYFDRALYAELQVANSPSAWDSLVVQPDDFLESDGFFDSLALMNGLSAGATLSGFSVLFNFLGVGVPGAQRFEILDPLTFEALDAGLTVAQVPPTTGVPEPSSLILLSLGLLGALTARRKLADNTSH